MAQLSALTKILSEIGFLSAIWAFPEKRWGLRTYFFEKTTGISRFIGNSGQNKAFIPGNPAKLYDTLHGNRNFRLTKICEKDRKDQIFISFHFTEIEDFKNCPSNENVRKQHLSANACSCVKMKFSYTIDVRKDEIFCRFLTKTSDFSLPFRSTIRDDI